MKLQVAPTARPSDFAPCVEAMLRAELGRLETLWREAVERGVPVY